MKVLLTLVYVQISMALLNHCQVYYHIVDVGCAVLLFWISRENPSRNLGYIHPDILDEATESWMVSSRNPR